MCFHCHCLGHIRINCQFYTCPTCLCNASNHVQTCCPLHHRSNPTRTLSFSSSSSNHFTSSMGSIHPVPPPLADRLSSPPRRAFHGSCHTHVTTAHIHTPSIRFCGVRPPTPGMDDDDVYDSDAWRNIMVNRIFRRCLNVTMGVMLRLPTSFSLSCTLVLSFSYCYQSSV